MPTRAESLAAEFEAANNDVIAAVAACPDSTWRATCPGDGRTVAVLAHHIATGHKPIAEFVQSIANGQPPRAPTPEMLDRLNAQHAQQSANVSKQEVEEALRTNGAAASEVVRGLSDEQLDRSAPAFGRDQISAEQAIRMVLIGHITDHLATMRAAGG